MSVKIIDIPSQSVRIAQLTPNHQNFTLIFQIAEITTQAHDYLKCRVVDDSGIINAVFIKYVNRYAINNVYKMQGLTAKIIDHHLQIHMTDNSTVERIPHKLGFKDKANDLSIKYFATKEQLQQISASQNTRNSITKKLQQKKQKKTEQKRQSENGNQEKQQKIESKKSVTFIQPDQKKSKKKIETTAIIQSKQQKQQKNTQEKTINHKPKYIEKKTSWTKLKIAVSKNHEEYVNVIAQICKKIVKSQNCFHIQLADDSGSMWAQFTRFQPQQGQIFTLDNFMVTKLKNQDGTFQKILKEVQLSQANVYTKAVQFVLKMQPVGEKQQE